MKNIEKLIKEAKGNKIALVVPKELVDTATEYFNDDGFTEFAEENREFGNFGIDYDNYAKEFDYGVQGFYVDQEYKLITLTKEDFKDITEDTNAAKSAVDNRTLLIVYFDTLYTNDKTDDIYFSNEEAKQFFMTSDNPSDYTVVPAYGKKFELKPHISIY